MNKDGKSREECSRRKEGGLVWDDGVERQLSVKVRWCVLDGVVSWGLGFGDGLGERGRWSIRG